MSKLIAVVLLTLAASSAAFAATETAEITCTKGGLFGYACKLCAEDVGSEIRYKMYSDNDANPVGAFNYSKGESRQDMEVYFSRISAQEAYAGRCK